MTTQTVLGESIKRREDPRLITGRGAYVDDVRMVGMLNLALARSPHAHARITGIDTSAAMDVDGVVAVYTGADLQEQLGSLICGWVVPDTKEVPHPPIAFDKVNTVGDVVAAVVANDPRVAADAAELVVVDYDVFDAVVDMETGIQDGAPQIHDDAPQQRGLRMGKLAEAISTKLPQARKSALPNALSTSASFPNPMETRGVVADFNQGTNQLTVYTSTQIPHLVRLLLALVHWAPRAPDQG